MDRQELIRDMKKEIGSFPNISQIAKYLNVSRNTVTTEIVSGLEFIGTVRLKKYFVNDVATRILERRTQ